MCILHSIFATGASPQALFSEHLPAATPVSGAALASVSMPAEKIGLSFSAGRFQATRIRETQPTPSDFPGGNVDSMGRNRPDLSRRTDRPLAPPRTPRKDFTPEEVANWLSRAIGLSQAVAEQTKSEQVDGAVMEIIVNGADRASLAELGIASRLKQTRVFTEWSRLA